MQWPAAFWAGNLFWPVANFVNFRFLGPQHRVAYVASCGVMWNTFISLLNSHLDNEAAREEEGLGAETEAVGGGGTVLLTDKVWEESKCKPGVEN